MNNKLFLICPECHIESAIRQEFDGNLFFLTALGTVFNEEDFTATDDVPNLIERENISEICVVNDPECGFLRDAVTGQVSIDIPATRYLSRLYNEYADSIQRIDNTEERAAELARQHVTELTEMLMSAPNLGQKIASGNLRLTGLLYDRQTAGFSEIGVLA